MRQNHKLFIDFLNKDRVGNIDDDGKKLVKARFVHESGEKHPKDALHMYTKKDPVMKRNKVVLNDLPGEIYTIVNTHWQQFMLFRIKNKKKYRRFSEVV